MADKSTDARRKALKKQIRELKAELRQLKAAAAGKKDAKKNKKNAKKSAAKKPAKAGKTASGKEVTARQAVDRPAATPAEKPASPAPMNISAARESLISSVKIGGS
jgi:hypothetical protein